MEPPLKMGGGTKTFPITLGGLVKQSEIGRAVNGYPGVIT